MANSSQYSCLEKFPGQRNLTSYSHGTAEIMTEQLSTYAIVDLQHCVNIYSTAK